MYRDCQAITIIVDLLSRFQFLSIDAELWRARSYDLSDHFKSMNVTKKHRIIENGPIHRGRHDFQSGKFACGRNLRKLYKTDRTWRLCKMVPHPASSKLRVVFLLIQLTEEQLDRKNIKHKIILKNV